MAKKDPKDIQFDATLKSNGKSNMENRLANKAYVSKLPALIMEQTQKVNDAKAIFESAHKEYPTLPGPAADKAAIEIACNARALAYEAQTLADLCKDFDTVCAIKEQADHAAKQLANKLPLFNALFGK